MARLASHAERLARLQQIIEAVVPSALARSCRIANYKLGLVVIHADNGAVAAKLRQIAPTLCSALLTSGSEVTEIRVKVQPRTELSPAASPHVSKKLSKHAKQALTALVKTIPEGSPLANALTGLVGKTSSKDDDALEEK